MKVLKNKKGLRILKTIRMFNWNCESFIFELLNDKFIKIAEAVTQLENIYVMIYLYT